MDSHRAIVLVGGEPSTPPGLTRRHRPGGSPTPPLVIAADSGMDLARDLGLDVTLLVGDMDSISAAALTHAERSGITVERHPTDKDTTDIELAMTAAVRRGATEILVLGGWGGRFDHLLANSLLLASPRFEGVSFEWRSRAEDVHVCRPTVPVIVNGSSGDTVSLIVVGSDAAGITTTGLRWALVSETLQSGTTRGVSNEMVGTEATVANQSGVLFVVHQKETP